MRRGGLLFTAGHLCCLAGLEVSRLWDFFPGRFRPLSAALVVAAFLLALGAALQPKRRLPAEGVVFLAWTSVTLLPLFVSAASKAVAVLFVSLLLAVPALPRSARLRVLPLAFLTGAFSSLLGFDDALLGLLLFLLLLRSGRGEAAPVSRPPSRGSSCRAEVLWRGFPRLYALSVPGEGERFSRRVQLDTVSVIRSWGGVRESGSEHRGVYRFPSAEALEGCRRALGEYGRAVNAGLESSGAPTLALVFETASERPVPPS